MPPPAGLPSLIVHPAMAFDLVSRVITMYIVGLQGESYQGGARASIFQPMAQAAL
jgi:hypothetical protein